MLVFRIQISLIIHRVREMTIMHVDSQNTTKHHRRCCVSFDGVTFF